MSPLKKQSLTLLCSLVIYSVVAQKVTVSKEINVKSNYAYDILPNIADKIIFYHDRGYEHSFEIFDQNLRYINTVQPEFEKSNIQPTGVIAMDSVFNFYYAYQEDGLIYSRVIAFDQRVGIKDSTTLSVKSKKLGNLNPKFISSKDKSKVLLFWPDENAINLNLVDNHSLELIYSHRLVVEGINLKSDFEKIVISDKGEVFILTRKNSFWSSKDDKSFILIKIQKDLSATVHNFTPETDQFSDLRIDFDNKNNRLVLAGLSTFGNLESANGYFAFSIMPHEIPEDAEILINKFNPEFVADVTGKKLSKAKEIDHFQIKDLIIKNDGGVLLVCELVKEFTRRNQINMPGQFNNNFPVRGYIDYYHEEILLLSTYTEGKEMWKKVLFKKQFSQDDSGIYSSFFIFKTPSRMRLIYNDEIKNSNTVSEYVMDPIGNVDRKSVLSTEYQNLKLRFRDAIQVSSSSLIIPSEKNYKINLVKIDYN